MDGSERQQLYASHIQTDKRPARAKSVIYFTDTVRRRTNLLLQRENVVLTATRLCHPFLIK
jgi:hypothetical protein